MQLRCGHCGEQKKDDQFYRTKTLARGRSSWCKECIRRSRDNDEYRQRIREQARQRRAHAK
jgi:hypothetical protein